MNMQKNQEIFCIFSPKFAFDIWQQGRLTGFSKIFWPVSVARRDAL